LAFVVVMIVVNLWKALQLQRQPPFSRAAARWRIVKKQENSPARGFRLDKRKFRPRVSTRDPQFLKRLSTA